MVTADIPAVIKGAEKYEDQGWTINIEFDTAKRTLRAAEPGCVYIIFGDNIYEEIRTLPRTIELYPPPVHPSGASPLDAVYPMFKGRRSRYHKVAGFLRNQMPHKFPELYSLSPFPINQALLDFLNTVSLAEIAAAAKEHYAETRRKPDPFISDFNEIIENLLWDKSQPFLLTLNSRSGLDYLDLLTMSAWFKARPRPPLIVFCQTIEVPRVDIDAKVIERSYASLDDLLKLANSKLAMPPDRAIRLLRILRPSLSKTDTSIFERNLITGHLGVRVIKFLEDASDAETDFGLSGSVPSQRLAPATFSIKRQQIDLRHEHSEKASEAQIYGGARALRSQCLAIINSISFGNLIPRYDDALARVASVLGIIIDSKPVDDSYLVELSIEIGYISNRAALARERLGNEATEELALFIMEARKYILRLDVVRQYEEQIRDRGIGLESGKAALDTLKDFASSSAVLSESAKARLQELTAISSSSLDGSHANGLVASVENLTAEAGHEIISTLKTASDEAVKKGAGKLGEKAAEGAANIIIRNAPNLYKIASEHGSEWIGVIVSSIEHLIKG